MLLLDTGIERLEFEVGTRGSAYSVSCPVVTGSVIPVTSKEGRGREGRKKSESRCI